MGYRSDVAYTIRFVDDEATNNERSFYTFLVEAKSNAATAACFTIPNAPSWVFEVDEEEYQINFYADSVKWYETFSDVQAHEALLSLAKEWEENDHARVGYAFARIGEESDDVEETVSELADWGWVSVGRSINRDW